jgi:T5SS/PEP-CTERM-associated repeat protein
MTGEIMKNKSVLQPLLTGLFVVLVLAASNSIVRAQDCPGTTTFTGGSGGADWFTAGNWDHCPPDATIDASINNGGQADISGGDAIAKSLILGDNQGEAGSVKNSAILDAGPSSCRGNLYIGNRGSGTLTISNQGYARCRYAYVAAVANSTGPNSNGNVSLEGGTTWNIYDTPPRLPTARMQGCRAFHWLHRRQ